MTSEKKPYTPTVMATYTALLLLACFINIRSMGAFSAKTCEMRGMQTSARIPRALWWLLGIAFCFVMFQGIVSLPKLMYSATYIFPVVIMTITIVALHVAFRTMHSDTYLLISLAPKRIFQISNMEEMEAFKTAEVYREYVMSLHCRYSFVVAGLTIVNMISMLWFQVF